MEYKTLSNGNRIPAFGFGTDLVPDDETIINAVTWAIEAGYRLIDNADCYHNETGVGIAIKNCIEKGIVKREDLFITNKVPDWKQGYDSTIKCCKESLKRTGLEYFDLYLVHSPYRQNPNWEKSVLDTYRAIETLYKEGLVKAIGVSNFEIRHLEFILREAKIKPMVNQFEIHPEHQQKHVVEFCTKNDIISESWGTLNQGRIFKKPVFLEMAKKYNKTPAQIAIRWSYQKGNIPLARSTKKERIESNAKFFDFSISTVDMRVLDDLDGGEFSNMHHEGIKPAATSGNMCSNKTGEALYYTKKYKLFGFLTVFKKVKSGQRITKWYLFNIPILKIDYKIKDK